MNFIPDQSSTKQVIYFEDARKEDGWQGHTTTKDIPRLMDEVKQALARLGGYVTSFQKGTFEVEKQTRQGFQIYYVFAGNEARLNVAALPVRDKWNDKLKDRSLKMSLYMLEIGLSGAWFMQILSPGYSPLIPFMLTESGATVSELWSKTSAMKQLLPPSDADFIEGEIK